MEDGEDGISLQSIAHPEGAIDFLADRIREMGGYDESFNKKAINAIEYLGFKITEEQTMDFKETEHEIENTIHDINKELMTTKLISDFYYPDGTLKPFGEREPIFVPTIPENDSQEDINRKNRVAMFLNFSYTDEMQKSVDKRFRDALLFGEGVMIMESPGEGKAIVVRHVGYNELRLDIVDSTDCPKCGSKYAAHEGKSEVDEKNDFFTCLICEELFEVSGAPHE